MNIGFQGRRLFSNTFILMVSCTMALETMCIFSTMVFPGRLMPPESLVGGSARTEGVQFCRDRDETCLTGAIQLVREGRRMGRRLGLGGRW